MAQIFVVVQSVNPFGKFVNIVHLEKTLINDLMHVSINPQHFQPCLASKYEKEPSVNDVQYK